MKIKHTFIQLMAVCALLASCEDFPAPNSMQPVMTTGEPVQVLRYEADLCGSFNYTQPTSEVTQCGILLSYFPSMAEAEDYPSPVVKTGYTYTINIRNLKPQTTYYYQAYAANDYSRMVGPMKSFITSGECLPVFGETVVVEHDCKSVVVEVKVLDEGSDTGIDSWGFCYRQADDGDPNFVNDLKDVELLPAADGYLRARITDLLPGHGYVIRPYAHNNMPGGPGYGFTLSLRTASTDIPIMSTVKTEPMEGMPSVLTTAALLSAGKGAVVEMGFCWDAQGTPTLNSFHTEGASADGTHITACITLKPGVAYRMCAYAINERGQVGYGEICEVRIDGQFVTTVSEAVASELTAYSMHLTASLISLDSDEAVVGQGFCYSDMGTPTVENALGTVAAPVMNADNEFSATIEKLTPQTDYIVRPYVQTNKGYCYGNSVTVTTAKENSMGGGVNPWEEKEEEGGEMQ